MFGDLPITQGLKGGRIFPQPALEQGLRFRDQPVAKHFLDTPMNALDQFARQPRYAKHTHIGIVRRFSPMGALFREWPPG
jgi:hypothetical protein